MALIIVESPNKCAKIKKILGDGYEVISSVGHIMDLSKKNLGVDFDTWEPDYTPYPNKKDVIQNIKRAAKNHDDIFVATDGDREGSCIAFNIKDILPKTGKNIKRVIFWEITKKGVNNGMNNPIPFNEDLFKAQQARRITDRLVGFKVSPVMWSKGLKGTSAGRVQSAALKFITEKEKEIRAFIKDEYWSVKVVTDHNFEADFYGVNGEKVSLGSEEAANKIVEQLTKPLRVSDYAEKTYTRKPPPPFITSTLQQSAGSKFKWTGKRVMDTAQSIFSQGLISYHRSDSVRCDPEKVKLIREQIKKKLGAEYLTAEPVIYGSKDDSQDAHEAIRPTFEAVPDTLMPDEKKLLKLIRDRFAASQMAPAEFERAKIELEFQGEETLNFKATGSIMKFDGFLKVYGETSNDESIPEIEKDSFVGIEDVIPTQHFTKPPGRYTEPSFVKKLEKEGIGRPSTYASLVETLIKRGYIERKKNTFFGTEIGILSCDYLESFFKRLTDSRFTATMESQLDDVAAGKADHKEILTKFYASLERDIDKANRGDARTIFKTDTDCPTCNNHSKMVRKTNEQIVFLGCENWPECGQTFNIGEGGELIPDSVETGTACPICSSKIQKRSGKFGEFWSCENYLSCSWKGKVDEEGNAVSKQKTQTTNLECPECKEAMLVKREGKFGDFLACDNYRETGCSFTANLDEDGNIIVKKSFGKKKKFKKIGKKCPKCKTGELAEREGRFGTFISCLDFPKCKHIEK